MKKIGYFGLNLDSVELQTYTHRQKRACVSSVGSLTESWNSGKSGCIPLPPPIAPVQGKYSFWLFLVFAPEDMGPRFWPWLAQTLPQCCWWLEGCLDSSVLPSFSFQMLWGGCVFPCACSLWTPISWPTHSSRPGSAFCTTSPWASVPPFTALCVRPDGFWGLVGCALVLWGGSSLMIPRCC